MPKKFISNGELRTLLEKATDDERLALTRLLNPKKDKAYDAKKLQKKICLEGGNDGVNYVRGQGTGYLDIIDDVLDKLDIDGFPSYDEVSSYDEITSPLADINDYIPFIDIDSPLKYKKKKARKLGIDYAEKAENAIILALLEKAYENMSEEEKKSFDIQVSKVASTISSDTTRNIAGATGLMVLANMGGFATYTFLTTSMSALTFGSLGFGAYTTATSMLSVILGPVGWVGLGTYAVYAYGAPDYQKLISIVATIGTIRQRVKYEIEDIHE